MLEVDRIGVNYGDVPALREVSLTVNPGEIVAVVGSNGAGKTTLVKAISSLVKCVDGRIQFEGTRTDRLAAHHVVRLGISHVPEGRQVFARMTVMENLAVGGYVLSAEDRAKKLEWVLTLFPILKERERQKAGTLSGGEQQTLAIARALMAGPKLLVLDEPSLGLMPKAVSTIFQVVQHLKAQGLTIMLVEQNVRKALELCDRAYVLQTGRTVLEGRGSELLGSDLVRKAYLGL